SVIFKGLCRINKLIILAKLQSPPPIPASTLLLIITRPSLYPFFLFTLPTNFQNENTSLGFITNPFIFEEDNSILKALFSCKIGSISLPVLIILDLCL